METNLLLLLVALLIIFLVCLIGCVRWMLRARREKQALEWRNSQLAQILEIGNTLRLNLNVESLLQDIVKAAQACLGFHIIVLNIVDEQTRQMRVCAHAGLDEDGQKVLDGAIYEWDAIDHLRQDRFRIGRCYFIPAGALNWIENFDGAVYVPGKESQKNTKLNHGRWHPEDACFVMIELGEGQILGSIWVDQPLDGMRPTRDALQALEYFANQVAVAVESARLYSAVRRQVEELDALRATANDISTELDLPKLLQAILGRAVNLLQAIGGELGLYDENENNIRVAVSYNMGQDTTDMCIALGEGAMGRVALVHEPLIIHDYAKWESRLPHYDSREWHAAIAAPLLIGGRLLGVIGIVHDNPQKRFGASDERLISLFAQQAAIAIENARLFQNAQQAARRREVLHQVSQEIVAVSPEPERIYTAIHQATARLMPSEAFVISLLTQDRQRIRAVYAIDLDKRVHPSAAIPMGDGLSGKVITGEKSIYVEDLQAESIKMSNVPHFGSPSQVRSVLAVPMRLGENIIGMLSTQSYRPKAYTAEDQYLLEMLASYAAIALENARLFKEVQQLAITDPLTQIYNRRHLFDLGQREFSRARRFHRPLSTIMLDIDHFKHFNDTYGHAIGDVVLQMLTERILGIIRDVDILGRYGGEEFVIILSETELAAALVVAERIRKQVSETPFLSRRGELSVTISLGVATMGKKTHNMTELIEAADTAMYRAKRAGRNKVES